ncbi:MAG: hypothetical protein AVDCRST_MAG59-2114, partial [uncultured Thermomicrobiales bacterium]
DLPHRRVRARRAGRLVRLRPARRRAHLLERGRRARPPVDRVHPGGHRGLLRGGVPGAGFGRHGDNRGRDRADGEAQHGGFAQHPSGLRRPGATRRDGPPI